MRKIKVTLITLFCLLAAAVLLSCLVVLPDRLLFSGGDSYSFYLGDTSKCCRVVTADRCSAAGTRLFIKNVCGESATYPSLDLNGFLEEIGGEVLFTEELDDSVNYYCSAPLPYSVNLYGKEINLHVCVKADGVTVASPIIFGGY